MMDDLDIDKLMLDMSHTWTGWISWKNVKIALQKQKLGKADPCKVKHLLIALGFAESNEKPYLERTKWTPKGIDYISNLKK